MIIRVVCNNCNSAQEVDTDKGTCLCQSCRCIIYTTSQDTIKAYKSRRFWARVQFVVLELLSLIFTIAFCRVFATVLDTDVFIENNWLIFAVWVIIAYCIYRRYEGRI